MKKVKCLSCHKEVTVKLVSFGFGVIAICPECKQLAYNNSKPGKEEKDEVKKL